MKNGGAAGGGVWVVLRLAELDATEDVDVALEDAVTLDCEVVLVAEVLGVVVLVTLVVVDLDPFGTENPTTPPMTMTTMTMTRATTGFSAI